PFHGKARSCCARKIAVARKLLKRPRRDAPSHLLKLDECAEKVLGMKEEHRFAVSARLRLSVAEHAGTRRHEPVTRGQNVGHFVTDMMHAAGRVLFQKG